MSASACTLEIDLSKIAENYRTLSKICKGTKVAAVVKANAYGLGAEKVAPALALAGAEDFFVAKVEEGVALRVSLGNKANIYVLNGVFVSELEAFIEHNLIPVLNFTEQTL